jgi:hypothetical protein
VIARINDKVDNALRDALTGAAAAEPDQIDAHLALLNDAERTEVLSLAMLVTCYAMVYACGAQWPVQSSVRRIAGALATKGTAAKQLNVGAEEIYAYLSRVVVGRERLQDVIPDEPAFTRLPVIVALQALVIYSPKEMETWDYLDQIESAIEIASALDPVVLPAAVMRAYMPKTEAEDQAHSA